MTRYLAVDDVVAMHADLIARYGGSVGLRDARLLEAAVFRPQSGYYPDIIAQAAALWESLSQNHPFIDGNKRAGFAAVYTFLAINGFEIVADADAVFAFLDDLYTRQCFEAATLERWLRENTAPNPRR